MSSINRYFKYQPQPYVHTQEEYPFEQLLKIGTIQEERKNKAIDDLDKVQELAASIPYAPGHKDYHQAIVGDISKDIEHIVQNYQPEDPEFLRQTRRLKYKIMNNEDVKNLIYSKEVYDKQWSPVLNNPALKGSIYNMPDIFNPETNEIMENRKPYQTLNYIPVQNIDDPIFNILQKHTGKVIGQLKDKKYQIIPTEHGLVFADPKGTPLGRVRDHESFAPVIKGIANLIESQTTPWQVYTKAKLKTRDNIEDYITNMAASLYSKELHPEDIEYQFIPDSKGGNDKKEEPEFGSPLPLPEYNIKKLDFKFDKNFNIVGKKIVGVGGKSFAIKDTHVEDNFSKMILDNIREKLNITDPKEVNKYLLDNQYVKMSDNYLPYNDPKKRDEITNIYFPFVNGEYFNTGVGFSMDFVDPNDPTKVLKGNQIGIASGTKVDIIGELPIGSYATKGYPGKVVNVGTQDNPKTYYMIDSNPKYHFPGFIASGINIALSDLGVGYIGADRIPVKITDKFIEYENRKGKLDRVYYNKFVKGVDPETQKEFTEDGLVLGLKELYKKIYGEAQR